MTNHRLRKAIYAAGLTPRSVATDLDVDPKTVERWMTQARVPYPRHRIRLAEALGTTEDYLWPDLPATADEEDAEDDDPAEAATAEIVHVYAHRSLVGQDLWRRLLLRSEERIDILVYAGLFLSDQHPQIVRLLREKGAAGTRVRLLLGDPGSAAVVGRGQEEGSGDAVPVNVRNAHALYRPLAGQPGVAVRVHRTTLYTSIYQFDDEMLVNPHVYGTPAAHAPVLHLRKVSFADLFETYATSFERVWQDAGPEWQAEPAGDGPGQRHGGVIELPRRARQ